MRVEGDHINVGGGVIAGRDHYVSIVTPSIRNLREMIESSSVDKETKERFRNQLNEYEAIAEKAATGVLEPLKGGLS